jgi:hypothetical protein
MGPWESAPTGGGAAASEVAKDDLGDLADAGKAALLKKQLALHR